MKLKFFHPFLAVLAVVSASARAQDNPPPLAPLPKIPQMDAPAAAQTAPADVVASAVTAVGHLGDEVVRGRYQAAIERMNAKWKSRVANQVGGMAVLEKQLAGVAQQMVQQGVSVISSKPQGQPRSYEVSPGKSVENVNGQQVETLIFKQWLVLVPTATRFRVVRQNDPKPLVIESTGFQAAISDKGANSWTFIDGSGLSVNDLRGLFGTLPPDLKLPPIEKKEIR